MSTAFQRQRNLGIRLKHLRHQLKFTLLNPVIKRTTAIVIQVIIENSYVQYFSKFIDFLVFLLDKHRPTYTLKHKQITKVKSPSSKSFSKDKDKGE